MNLLVSGASGFIGKHLVRYLQEEGYCVHFIHSSRFECFVFGCFGHLAELLASDRPLEKAYVLSSGRHYTLRSLASLYERCTGSKLSIDWGGRPYRLREVMMPSSGLVLPGWCLRFH